MEKKNIFTKILAITGTALVWCPLVFPVLLCLAGLIAGQGFHLDYLMPAEFFPFALAGGALLLWAALRRRAHRALIGWGLGLAAGFLVGGQALAVYTGISSGSVEPGGWQYILVLGSLVVFSLALVVMGIGGIALLRDLVKEKEG